MDPLPVSKTPSLNDNLFLPYANHDRTLCKNNDRKYSGKCNAESSHHSHKPCFGPERVVGHCATYITASQEYINPKDEKFFRLCLRTVQTYQTFRAFQGDFKYFEQVRTLLFAIAFVRMLSTTFLNKTRVIETASGLALYF